MTKDEIAKKINENHKLIQEQISAGFAVVDKSEEEASAYVLSVCKLLAENIELIFESEKLRLQQAAEHRTRNTKETK